MQISDRMWWTSKCFAPGNDERLKTMGCQNHTSGNVQINYSISKRYSTNCANLVIFQVILLMLERSLPVVQHMASQFTDGFPNLTQEAKQVMEILSEQRPSLVIRSSGLYLPPAQTSRQRQQFSLMESAETLTVSISIPSVSLVGPQTLLLSLRMQMLVGLLSVFEVRTFRSWRIQKQSLFVHKPSCFSNSLLWLTFHG